MRWLAILVAALLAAAFAPLPRGPRGVAVASKKFTESVILGEMLVQLIEASGQRATHLAELGGTTLVFDALVRGEVDLYPEYVGTIRQEILAGQSVDDDDQLRSRLLERGVAMSAPLGFSNNYALAVRRELAERLGLATIDDLARQVDLRLGLSNEFLDRADGWKNLRKHYGLTHREVAGMDHDVAYRRLAAGSVDVIDVYTTDARLAELDLVLLDDNRGYFPSYEAVVLYREAWARRHPDAARQIARLEGQLDADSIIALNARVESGAANEAQAAASFLRDQLGVAVTVDDVSVARQIGQRTLEHLDLVRRSLIPAILAAVPLGVLAAKFPRLGQGVLGLVGVVQTIPALALLVLLIAPVAWLGWDTLGAGSATAIVALFLYSLLPIVRNTAAGLRAIPPEYQESATALGLSPGFRLLHVELPLASPAILTGIKTAAVLNVGFATLGALVGARGYGQPILTGIRLNNTALIMQGAIPAACLALALQAAFELAERWIVPAGLRLTAASSSGESSHVHAS